MDRDATFRHPWFFESRPLALIIVTAFLLLSGTAFYLCYEHYKSATEQALKEDRATANLASLILQKHLQMIVKTMESYASRPLLVRALREKNKNVNGAMRHLITLKESNPGMDIIVIIDKEGTFWASYPERPELLGQNIAHRDWYKGVSKDWKPHISELILRIVREKDTAIHISTPIFDQQGMVLGILANTQRTTELGKIIKRIPLDPELSVSITDRKGNIVYSSRYPFHKEITPYPFFSVIHTVKAGTNPSVAVDDRGEKRYVSFASSTDMGWHVFVGRSSRAILLSEMSYYVQTASIALLLFLMIALSLVYFRKRVMLQMVMGQLKADKELRKSEEKFGAVLDATPFPIAVVDLEDDKIDFWSRSARVLFGHTAPTASEWYQIAYPDPTYRSEVINRWKPFLDIARQSRRTVNAGEYRVTCRDGSVRICELYATFLPDNLVVTFNDVTERKRAEEALRENEERYRNIFNNVIEGIFQTTPAGRYRTINPAFARMFGYDSPEEMISAVTNIGEQLYVNPGDRMRLIEQISAKGKMVTNFEVELLRKDRSRFWVSINAAMVRDVENGAAFIEGTCSDVTERKRAEEEIRILNTELEQRVAERTAELQKAVAYLEELNRVFVGRELRMAELKAQIAELERQKS